MKMAQMFPKCLDPCCCSVCLDPLKEPVTIPCGHSYCMMCISRCWDQEDRRGVYSCPQCRFTFRPRPALRKSTVLAELVEKLKATENRSAAAELFYAGPGDVECDFCTGRKLKAVKSCLVCMASYCETHIQPHYQSEAFKRHKLTEASRRLHKNICPQHNRVLEVYCRSDGNCICVLCTMDEHRGHNTISAAAAKTEKLKLFEETRTLCHQLIEKREVELHVLKKTLVSFKEVAVQAEQRCEQALRELFRCAEVIRAQAVEAIWHQQGAAEGQAKGSLLELQQELEQLWRTRQQLQELTQEDDHVHFLQILPTIPSSFETKDFKPPYFSPDLIKDSFSGLTSKAESTLGDGNGRIRREVVSIFFEVNEFSRLDGRASSPALIHQNISWHVALEPLVFPHSNRKFVCIMLCSSLLCQEMLCETEANVRVINHQEDGKSVSRTFEACFCDEGLEHGIYKLMSWDDAVDPAKGFVRNDTVSIVVTFQATLLA